MINQTYLKKLFTLALSTTLLFSSFVYADKNVISESSREDISVHKQNTISVSKATDNLNESIKTIKEKIENKKVLDKDIQKLTDDINSLEQATTFSNTRGTKDSIAAVLNAEILLLHIPNKDTSATSSAIDKARETLEIFGYKAALPNEEINNQSGQEFDDSVKSNLVLLNERIDFLENYLKDDPNILSRPVDRVAVPLSHIHTYIRSHEIDYIIALNDEDFKNEILSSFVRSEKILETVINEVPDGLEKSKYLASTVHDAKSTLKIQEYSDKSSKNNKISSKYYISTEQAGGSPVKIIRTGQGTPIKLVSHDITLPSKDELKVYGNGVMYEDHERAYIQKAFETIKIIKKNNDYYISILLPELPEGFLWDYSYYAMDYQANYLCSTSYFDLDRHPGQKEWKLENVTSEEIEKGAFAYLTLSTISTVTGEEGLVNWRIGTNHHEGYIIESLDRFTYYDYETWLPFDNSNYINGWK